MMGRRIFLGIIGALTFGLAGYGKEKSKAREAGLRSGRVWAETWEECGRKIVRDMGKVPSGLMRVNTQVSISFKGTANFVGIWSVVDLSVRKNG
jgi:hypothetical protein